MACWWWERGSMAVMMGVSQLFCCCFYEELSRSTKGYPALGIEGNYEPGDEDEGTPSDHEQRHTRVAEWWRLGQRSAVRGEG